MSLARVGRTAVEAVAAATPDEVDGGLLLSSQEPTRRTAAARQEREWLRKVRVVSTSQPLLPPKVDEQVFEQVCNALYGDQWLTVEY